MRTSWSGGFRPVRVLAPNPAIIPIIVVLMALASGANAAEHFASVSVGNYTALTYPTGSRNLGMGATGTADLCAHATVFFKPASLAWPEEAIERVQRYRKVG